MKPDGRRIAAVHGTSTEGAQDLLANAAADWRAHAAKIAGVTAQTHNLPGRTCSAGVLCDIATGDRFRIYLESAPQGTSCHLDAEGVSAACTSVMEQIADCDLVILSKFGKLEAMRQGLFPAFEAAIAAGKPLLTTVSPKHREAWEAFAPDAARLEADGAALSRWWSQTAP
jgi:hypothetical protein